jgi:hypothetical protein
MKSMNARRGAGTTRGPREWRSGLGKRLRENLAAVECALPDGAVKELEDVAGIGAA